MNHRISRDEAAEVFVGAVAKTGLASRRGVIEGLVTGIPKDPFEPLSQWYGSLSDQDKEFARKLVHVTMDQSVFGLLCLLDGVAGHERIEDKLVHFGLSFELYRNIDRLMSDDPELSVHLNRSLEEDHLHDLFADVMEEMKEST